MPLKCKKCRGTHTAQATAFCSATVLRTKLEAWFALAYAPAPFKVAKAERELREACLAVWPDFVVKVVGK
jgi:hypothetical protein